MKNVKYYAGLFDADGSFDIWPTKRDNGSYYINIKAVLYQKDKKVFNDIVEEYGVEVKQAPTCSYITLHGSKAEMFMNIIKKHLVIKRDIVDLLLSLKGKTTNDIKGVRKSIQEARKRNSSGKNHPSRQWMAGYVDGDGCLHSSFRKKDGNLEFKLSVVSHYTQEAGLLLLQKAFGGYITKQGSVRKWNLCLSRTKGKQVLPFFKKHLKVKKEQADLILDCLNTGKHFRKRGASYEGNRNIHLQLQELKLPATTKLENS
jgi:hypothetical protein